MRLALLALLPSLLFSGCYLSHEGLGGRPCGGVLCAEADVCCPTCDGAGMCQTADLPCPDLFCPEGCAGPADCAGGEWCALPAGVCGGLGDCRPLPPACPGDCPGVCGCDGVDYCNECGANALGVNVASFGPCTAMVCGDRVCPPGTNCCPLCFGELDCVPGPPGLCPDVFCPAECRVNEECGPFEYCAFAPLECGPSREPGRCEPRPDFCEDDCPGACGCDGTIYCSECHARRAGVNVTGDERCGPPPCGPAGLVCADGEYCDLGAECGAAGRHRCRGVPVTCSGSLDPVCGCDGVTYGNACLARQAGATVATTGECPLPEIFASCLEVLRARPGAASGPYLLAPEGVPVEVWCDLVTDGGGWTLVASTHRQTLDDAAGEWHDDLSVQTPRDAHPLVWRGMRAVVGDRADVRFTCRDGSSASERVDLSFYDVRWYSEWTLGSDADSCFSEQDGAGFDRPAPRRRDNVAGVGIAAGTDWGAGYLEGEDSCGDDGDFTVDLRDRGMDSNEADGTDWGEDDTAPKCGSGLLMDGVWQIWVRER